MFLLRQPSPETIRQFISSQQQESFSYTEVGASRDGPITGYTIDHNRVKLGEGETIFARAVAALQNWKQFELGWVRIVPPGTTVAVGSTVAVLAQPFGIWSLNACRVVYVIDDKTAEGARFGFAYGTLPDHAECGEERFSVEWQRTDDSVWYDILAFSRPNLLARMGYPFTRRLQKKFARDSMAAMVRAAG